MTDRPLLVQSFLRERLRSAAGVWCVPAGSGRPITVIADLVQRVRARATVTEDSVRLEEGVVKLLRGFEGIFHAQFSGSYLLDLNPRPYGSLRLAT